jgi:hypothetical protein
VFLFFASFAFVLWRNAHLTILWDLSYILETATRISLGQLPYRDFPMVHAPLTFLVQAAIIKLFGRVVFHHYLYAAVTSGLGSVLTWRILLRLLAATRLPRRLVAFLLAAPLIFLGTNSIYPGPFYDSDCTVFILFCIWLLLRLESINFPRGATFACGLLFAVPPFIKQNTGLAFLLSAVFCIAYFGFRNRRASILLLAGAATGLACALALIKFTVGLRNYLFWTVQFASSHRLPGLSTLLRGVYWGGSSKHAALFWIYIFFVLGPALVLLFRQAVRPAACWLASTLLALPFLAAVAELFLSADAQKRTVALLALWPIWLIASFAIALWKLPRATALSQLLPFVLLGTIHGALLSQQVAGSTYALWPMLLILIAASVAALAPTKRVYGSTESKEAYIDLQPSTVPITVFTAVVSFTLLLTGGYYAISHARLSYVDLSGATLAHSSLPALSGLAMRGQYLPDFEELVTYSDREIPRGDAILMLPGEDLFYFTTGRKPQFPLLLLDSTMNPYSAVQIVQIARERGVRWLIVKRRLQLNEAPLSFQPQLLELLYHDFECQAALNNYLIYRRKSESRQGESRISNTVTLPCQSVRLSKAEKHALFGLSQSDNDTPVLADMDKKTGYHRCRCVISARVGAPTL